MKKFLTSRFWNQFYATGGSGTWFREPVVRRRLNLRITGSQDLWPIDWLASELGPRRFARALSLGCGEGALERDLMSKDLCGAMVGLDLSEQALELARQRAAEAGCGAIEYRCADLRSPVPRAAEL